MGKVYTRFQTKTAQKPYLTGRHISIKLIYWSTPPPRAWGEPNTCSLCFSSYKRQIPIRNTRARLEIFRGSLTGILNVCMVCYKSILPFLTLYRCDLVPVFAFGQNNLFPLVGGGYNSRFSRFQRWLYSKTHAGCFCCWGLSWCLPNL